MGFCLFSNLVTKVTTTLCPPGGLSATGRSAGRRATAGSGRGRSCASGRSALLRRRRWRTRTVWPTDQSNASPATTSPARQSGSPWTGPRYDDDVLKLVSVEDLLLLTLPPPPSFHSAHLNVAPATSTVSPCVRAATWPRLSRPPTARASTNLRSESAAV